MFSPELMKFLIKYQSEEYLPKEKNFENEKNDDNSFIYHRFTKYAVVPIKVER